MLAYVFWHWPRADVAAAAYETVQRRFHATLRDNPPPRFLGSRSLAVAGARWAAAVSPAYRGPHDAAAAAAEGGTAGLYRLRQGAAADPPLAAAWFTKPPGMSYVALFAMLEPLIAAEGAALWARQMTLGPTPEFCLHTGRPVELPAALFPVAVRCRPVWP
jgi:hypothetical protein